MTTTLPLFVGLDYSPHAVQLCVLDPQGKVLCNRAVPTPPTPSTPPSDDSATSEAPHSKPALAPPTSPKRWPTASPGPSTSPTPDSSAA
jgi:hypothetical protein